MIRIFIGCAPNHEDAESQSVVEWSIRKHASEPVDITWMKLIRDPASPFHGWDTSQWPTPFSGFRWAVPELAGFEGRAIYMDSDVMVLADIAELWHQAIGRGKAVVANGHTRLCVSLWDCAAAKPYMLPIDELKRRPDNHSVMRRVMRNNSHIVQAFAGGQWNCLDGGDFPASHPSIKAIHYSSMPHQPHIGLARKRLAKDGRDHWFDGTTTAHWRPDITALFHGLLAEAERNGYPVERYTQDPIYGEYDKRSVASLDGRVPRWGNRS